MIWYYTALVLAISNLVYETRRFFKGGSRVDWSIAVAVFIITIALGR